jgi:hypothetical protein
MDAGYRGWHAVSCRRWSRQEERRERWKKTLLCLTTPAELVLCLPRSSILGKQLQPSVDGQDALVKIPSAVFCM